MLRVAAGLGFCVTGTEAPGREKPVCARTARHTQQISRVVRTIGTTSESPK